MAELILKIAPAWAEAHAAPLLVVTPLIAGAIAAVLPWGRAAWALLLAVMIASLGFAAVLAAQIVPGGAVISYELGGWVPPIGIEYRVDGLNVGMLVLVAAIGLLMALYAPESAEDEIEPGKHPLFYAAFLICFAGLMGVAITGDAFNLFVFLEISSISTYALVAMGNGRDRRALTAAYNYLILGTIGATFFVIGVGFLYMSTGTLNLVDIAARMAEFGDSRTIQAGFAFIVIGLGLKLAMYPLHVWLPNAYAFAPTVITAFLAATATKVAFYALARFVFVVFDQGFTFEEMALIWLIAPLGVVGMIAASLQAVFQTDVRRLLAYSSVAQVGYMLLGLGIGTAAGVSAGFLHLFNHAVMKGALFLALGAASICYGVTHVRDLRGLARTMPFTSAALAIGGASLIGVPGTAGFVSKWALFNAALDKGWYWAVAAIAAASILAFFYVGRMMQMIYLQPAPERGGREAPRLRAPWLALTPMWALAAASILFGWWAALPVALADAAAGAIGGGAP